MFIEGAIAWFVLSTFVKSLNCCGNLKQKATYLIVTPAAKFEMINEVVLRNIEKNLNTIIFACFMVKMGGTKLCVNN